MSDCDKEHATHYACPCQLERMQKLEIQLEQWRDIGRRRVNRYVELYWCKECNHTLPGHDSECLAGEMQALLEAQNERATK